MTQWLFGTMVQKPGQRVAMMFAASRDNVPMARTTYNPDFNGIMALYDEVFQLNKP